MKVLIHEVLGQKIRELYPSLPPLNFDKMTITQMIFRN
jgi:hypothetical protein